MKKYEFMVEDGHELVSDIPFKIVDGYWGDEFLRGYDIYQVETDDPSDIRVLFNNGIVYEPCEVFESVNGDEVVYHVMIWNPIA